MDTSLSGVRIRVHHDGVIPTSFRLLVDDMQADCEIVWRKGRELGARVLSYRPRGKPDDLI